MRATARSIMVLAIAAATCAQASDVWRWKDAQGVVHYSDVPVEGAVRVKTSSSGSGSLAQNSGPATNSAGQQLTPLGVAQVEEQRQLDAAGRAVQQDLSKKRSEQCKAATTRYDGLITSHRVFKEDEKGQRVYLTAQELDEARIRARQERDAVCSATPPR